MLEQKLEEMERTLLSHKEDWLGEKVKYESKTEINENEIKKLITREKLLEEKNRILHEERTKYET